MVLERQIVETQIISLDQCKKHHPIHPQESYKTLALPPNTSVCCSHTTYLVCCMYSLKFVFYLVFCLCNVQLVSVFSPQFQVHDRSLPRELCLAWLAAVARLSRLAVPSLPTGTFVSFSHIHQTSLSWSWRQLFPFLFNRSAHSAGPELGTHVYIYIYIYICTCIYIYMYIYTYNWTKR